MRSLSKGDNAQGAGHNTEEIMRFRSADEADIKHVKTAAFILTFLLSAAVSAPEPRTGYAPVNGLKMGFCRRAPPGFPVQSRVPRVSCQRAAVCRRHCGDAPL